MLDRVKDYVKEHRAVITTAVVSSLVSSVATAAVIHNADDHWTSVGPADSGRTLVITTKKGHTYKAPWKVDEN